MADSMKFGPEWYVEFNSICYFLLGFQCMLFCVFSFDIDVENQLFQPSISNTYFSKKFQNFNQ